LNARPADGGNIRESLCTKVMHVHEALDEHDLAAFGRREVAKVRQPVGR
jgi:hypothetical protein